MSAFPQRHLPEATLHAPEPMLHRLIKRTFVCPFIAVLIIFQTAIAYGDDRRGFTVASWNIQELGDGEGRDRRRRSGDDYTRLRKYVDLLDADVVAIQEIENEVAAYQVFDRQNYVVVLERPDGSSSNMRTGFAIKRGISFTRNPDYEDLGLDDLRDGTDITLRLGEKNLRLLAVHLKAKCPDRPIQSENRDCQKLHEQIASLRSWLEARFREAIPFVVLGDFNRRLGNPDEEFLAAIGNGLVAVAKGYQECGTEHLGKGHVSNFLLGGGAEKFWDGNFSELLFASEDAAHLSGLSDHCPLKVTLSFPAPVIAQSQTANQRPVEDPPSPPVTDDQQPADSNYEILCTGATSPQYLDLCQQWRMAEAAEEQAKWPKRQFWATVAEVGALAITVLFTGWAAIAAGRAARAANKSVSVAEETAERQLRAYVNCTGSFIEGFEGLAPHLAVNIQNQGQTPAYDVTIAMDAKPSRTTQSTTLCMCKRVSAITRLGVIGPQAGIGSTQRIDPPLTSEQKAAIKSGKARIYGVWAHHLLRCFWQA